MQLTREENKRLDTFFKFECISSQYFFYWTSFSPTHKPGNRVLLSFLSINFQEVARPTSYYSSLHCHLLSFPWRSVKTPALAVWITWLWKILLCTQHQVPPLESTLRMKNSLSHLQNMMHRPVIVGEEISQFFFSMAECFKGRLKEMNGPYNLQSSSLFSAKVWYEKNCKSQVGEDDKRIGSRKCRNSSRLTHTAFKSVYFFGGLLEIYLPHGQLLHTALLSGFLPFCRHKPPSP